VTSNPTAVERVLLAAAITSETASLQKVQSIMPTIGDGELRQFFEGCVTTGTAHIRAMVDVAKAQGLTH